MYFTDCLVFVQGLVNPDKASLSLQSALSDFIFLCSSFNSVKVVNRTLVKCV